MALPDKIPVPVLILRSTQDEATGLLGLLPLVSNVCVMLLHGMLTITPSHFGFGRQSGSDADLWRSFTRFGLIAGGAGLLAGSVAFTLVSLTGHRPSSDARENIALLWGIALVFIAMPNIMYLGITPIIYGLRLQWRCSHERLGRKGISRV